MCQLHAMCISNMRGNKDLKRILTVAIIGTGINRRCVILMVRRDGCRMLLRLVEWMVAARSAQGIVFETLMLVYSHWAKPVDWMIVRGGGQCGMQ